MTAFANVARYYRRCWSTTERWWCRTSPINQTSLFFTFVFFYIFKCNFDFFCWSIVDNDQSFIRMLLLKPMVVYKLIPIGIWKYVYDRIFFVLFQLNLFFSFKLKKINFDWNRLKFIRRCCVCVNQLMALVNIINIIKE